MNVSMIGRPGRARLTGRSAEQVPGQHTHQVDRDRGEPCGSTPPTPPGIRVRTTAVRSDYACEESAKRGRPTESKYALRSACWTAGWPDMRHAPVGEPAATAAPNTGTP